jgi:hypothetical protein
MTSALLSSNGTEIDKWYLLYRLRPTMMTTMTAVLTTMMPIMVTTTAVPKTFPTFSNQQFYLCYPCSAHCQLYGLSASYPLCKE